MIYLCHFIEKLNLNNKIYTAYKKYIVLKLKFKLLFLNEHKNKHRNKHIGKSKIFFNKEHFWQFNKTKD